MKSIFQKPLNLFENWKVWKVINHDILFCFEIYMFPPKNERKNQLYKLSEIITPPYTYIYNFTAEP